MRRYAWRQATARSQAHAMTPAQELGFLPTSIFNLSRLAPQRVPCPHRNSAAYLVDFAAPIARYPAKPVAPGAGQTRRLQAKEGDYFFARRHSQIRRLRG
jgi:hypothetical protein